MAQTNAQRQQKFRAARAKSHRKVEVILDFETYELLQLHIMASGKNQQDYLVDFIGSLPKPESEEKALLVTKSKEIKKAWKGYHKCQGVRSSGKLCRNEGKNIVSWVSSLGVVYEALSCEGHASNFILHETFL